MKKKYQDESNRVLLLFYVSTFWLYNSCSDVFFLHFLVYRREKRIKNRISRMPGFMSLSMQSIHQIFFFFCEWFRKKSHPWMKGDFAIASFSTLVYWQIFALKYVTRNARQAFTFKLGCHRDNALSFVYTITFVYLIRSLARFYFLSFCSSFLPQFPVPPRFVNFTMNWIRFMWNACYFIH